MLISDVILHNAGGSLAWLLTRQLTMVAPWRLMVQVVLLPLSMGTTGTWHAILVTPTPAAHWSSVAAAADCFYYVRLECHLVARRDTSSHPDKDPGPGPDAPHSTHTFIVSHTQTYLIMPLSVLIPCRRHFRAPKFYFFKFGVLEGFVMCHPSKLARHAALFWAGARSHVTWPGQGGNDCCCARHQRRLWTLCGVITHGDTATVAWDHVDTVTSHQTHGHQIMTITSHLF